MALVLACVLIALAWTLGALQLWPRTRGVGAVLPWLGGALALGFAACVAAGIAGLLGFAGWESPSNAQALHRVLGEGNLVMRRTDWAWWNQAAGIVLQLDLAWTLLVLCAATLHGWLFWAGVAEDRRQARVRRGRAALNRAGSDATGD